MAEKKKKPLGKRLRSVYRLSLLRENTFEEVLFVRLSPLNLIVSATVALLFTALAVFFLIAATPLRELLPGRADPMWKTDAAIARKLSDSLLRVSNDHHLFLRDLQTVLAGGVVIDSLKRLEPQLEMSPNLLYAPSAADSGLRASVSNQDNLRLVFGEGGDKTGGASLMFKPLEGLVSNRFDSKKGHFGIDIAAPENEVIKSVMDGTVMMAVWTSKDGHVIQVQHSGNTISVYKHNSVLLKQVGEKVKAGDPLAIIGNSGENSEGPHLHFELWRDGVPVNPLLFLSYE